MNLRRIYNRNVKSVFLCLLEDVAYLAKTSCRPDIVLSVRSYECLNCNKYHVLELVKLGMNPGIDF
jgi:hypothetical protein